MSIEMQLEAQIQEHLKPIRMLLVNESKHHNVPAGSQSHWNLILVTPQFAGQSLLARHRMVYAAIGASLMQKIHALTMKLLTLEEWEAAGGEATNPAPPCLGGRRKHITSNKA